MSNENPFDQAQPTATPVSATGQPANNNVAKKSKAGLIAIISGIVVLVAILVGIGLYFTLTVSKKDYKDAQAEAQKIANAVSGDSGYMKALDDNPLLTSSLSNTNLSSLSSSYKNTVSESDLEKYAKNIEGLKSELKTDTKKLADMKGIKKDKDAKAKFDQLQSVYNKFDKDLALMDEIYSDDGLKPTIIATQEMMSSMGSLDSIDSIEGYQTLYSKMATAFRKIGDAAGKAKISDSDLSKKTQALSKEYIKMADLFDKAARIMETRDVSGAQSIQSEMTTVSSEVETVASDFEQAFSDRASEIDKNGQDLVDKINDLGRYLSDKANK